MMEKRHISLTDAEWNVMECLWERSPRTGRELTEALEGACGWNRSTTLTLLRRLEAKGAVGTETDGRVKTFLPLVSREEAALVETESLLTRAYHGSLSMMVSALTKRQALSREERDALYAILDRTEVDGDA
jgi:BlaI family penicillinase repressor